MSGKQTGIVWELDLPLPQKIILLAMADHADQNGDNVHPSIGLIAWKSGYSPRHVQRIINALEKAKLIVLNEKDFGKYHTVDYSLNLDDAKRLPEYKGRGSITKDEKAVASGRKAKATRVAKMSPCDTMMSHPPMTSGVTPPMTSGCHTNGSGTVVETGGGAEPAPALPKEKTAAELQADADFDAMPSQSAGMVPQEHTAATADPRVAERQFVKEIAPVCAQIMGREKPISEDTRTAKKIFRKHLPLAGVLARLDAYRNGEGAEFRKPEAIADWIVGRLERDLVPRVLAENNDAAIKARLMAA